MPYKDPVKYKAAQARYAKRKTAAARAYVRQIKDGSSCMDCGVKYPYYVMDFDHRIRADKLETINVLAGSGRLAAIIKEIKKCDLVCANCHRERTYQQTLPLAVNP